MKLIEEVQKIFEENRDRLSSTVIMELADDIIEHLVGLVSKSEAEYDSLKEQLTNKVRAEIESTENKIKEKHANKS